jgi:hypothetical protein|tara:strand:- start:195 stop:1586 length:1392 start_codon:yes stop_codon:yes gene_type:complete
MPAIITKDFRLHNARQFEESFGEAADTYYLAIGRPQAFVNDQAFNDGTDASPPTPVDDVGQVEYYAYDDFLSAKKITSTDVTLAIPRRNWTTGTVYDYYRHDYGDINSAGSTITSDSGASSLYDATFFVMNSTFDVYKCIDNNSGAASTVEPTGNKSTSVFTTGDSYKWKYMYSLSASEQSNFMSTDFIHASTESTDYSTTGGAIEHVKVTAGGSSGSDGTYTGVAIRGDGSGGECTVVVSSNAVSSVTITTAGSGYTFASVLASDIGSVSGADIDFIISPPGGHASDIPAELGAFFVMTNVNFTQADGSGDFSTGNDFRRIALVRNPTDSTTGSTATASTLDATKSITFSGTPGSFQADEKITQATTGAVGFVVDFNASTKVLRYVQPQFADQGVDSNGNLTAFASTHTVTGATSSATGTPSSHDTTPEFTHDTGDILYIENRKPISRASDQTENVKLIIEF